MDHANSGTNVERAILDELRTSALTMQALKTGVKNRVGRLDDKLLKASLAALFADRKIHGEPKFGKNGKPTKSIETYRFGPPPPPPPSPRERAPNEILTILAEGPLSPAALKAHLGEKIGGLSATDLKAALSELTDAQQIHSKFGRGKNGKPTKTVESYALGGVPLEELITPVITTWKEAREAAAKAGVRYQALVAALLAALVREGVAVGPVRASEATADDGANVLNGVRELVAREGHGALIPIRKLRSVLQLPKARFDRALLDLYAADTLILHHHDYVGNLSDSERDELVLDRHGNYYVGVALRGEN